MSAVFIPVAFMGGPSGIFYRQFSLTMAIAIVLSGVVALTLTPALCALLLKITMEKRQPCWLNFSIASTLGIRGWKKIQKSTVKIVTRRIVTFGVLLAFCIGTGLLNKVLPTGFIPNEDQGTFYASVTTPPVPQWKEQKKLSMPFKARRRNWRAWKVYQHLPERTSFQTEQEPLTELH